MKMMIVRGFVIGGSLGIFAAISGIEPFGPRTAILGGIIGALAGYTAFKMSLKRKEQSNKKEQ